MKKRVKTPDGIRVVTNRPQIETGVPWTGYIHPKHIKPNPKQPRETFPEDAHQRLQESHSVVGQQRAISVLPYIDPENPDIWFIIHDGERSWRSAVALDGEAVLVLYNPILTMEDLDFQSFVANFGSQAHAHNEIINAVCKEVLQKGRTVRDVAKAVTRSEVWVGTYLHLRNLHPELRKLLDAPTPKNSRLPLLLAQTIAKAEQNKQLEIYEGTKGKSAKVAVREARNKITKENRVQGRERVPSDDWKIAKRIFRSFQEDLHYLAGLDPERLRGVGFDKELTYANMESVVAAATAIYKKLSGRDLPQNPNINAPARLIAKRRENQPKDIGLSNFIDVNKGRASEQVS